MKFAQFKCKQAESLSEQKQHQKHQIYEQNESLKSPNSPKQQQSESNIDKIITPQKSSNEQLINPFLFFHSPDDSVKSPFKKQKKIRKNIMSLEQNKDKINQVCNKNQQKNLRENQSIIFTHSINNKQIPKIGMLLITRDQWKKGHTLIYSRQKRCLIRIPICKKCNKIFENTEALGGHIRACKKI